MTKFSERILNLKGRDIVLREAAAPDADALVEFLTAISLETPYTYNYPGQKLKPEIMTARLSSDQKSTTNLKIVAVDKTKIIAQIMFWKNAPDHPWLQHKGEFAMMVLKEWWGSGLAKELLTAMLSFAKAIGTQRIDATVSCENARGLALYESHGFVIEGKAKGYKIVDGKPMDSYFIAKYL